MIIRPGDTGAARANSLGFGHTIAKPTVWQILTDNGIELSPNRSKVTWSEFLHSQSAVACDFFTFFTGDTAFWSRYYILFFIKAQTSERCSTPASTARARPGPTICT